MDKLDKELVFYDGFTRTKKEWANLLGISVSVFDEQVKKWGVEKAILDSPRLNKKRSLKDKLRKTDSVCWNCQAVLQPSSCSWLREHVAVPGSIAAPKIVTEGPTNKNRKYLLHIMNYCPQYEERRVVNESKSNN